MRRIQNAMLVTSVVFASLSPTARSQTAAGGVAGTVKDSSGATVRDVVLTLTNDATNVVQTTRSTSSGTYVLEGVPVGTYTLKADAHGFKAYVLTGIQVHVQSIVTADIALQVGSVSQEVTVTSAVPLLQAQDASLGQTVPTVQVNDLPLNGRNWLSLAQLSAGTYATAGTNSQNPAQIQANGVSQNQVDYRLNGIDNNVDVFETGANGQAGSVTPVPDAMQEFKLQDGNNSAEFGGVTGAVVNAVIKSGTNQIRGDAWEYLRHDALNANDYFNKQNNKPRQPYRQNQWGFTVGGPVYIPHFYNGRDKTFFFFDFQHTGITQQNSFTDTVPTDSMRSSMLPNSNFINLQDLITGNSKSATDLLGRTFSHGTVLDPETTRPVTAGQLDVTTGLVATGTGYVRDPFYTGGSVAGITNFTGLTSQLNMLPMSRIDQNAVKLLQLLPAPTTSGLLNNYYVTPAQTSTVNQYDVRIDESINASNSVWGVFSRSIGQYDSYQPFPGVAGGALQIAPNDSEPHYSIASGYTHVFSPTFENDFTFGYNHVDHNLTMPTASTLGIPAQYGVQGIPQIANNGGLPTIDYSGFSSFGGRRFMPTIQTTSALQFADNVMKIHGRHELKMGGEYKRIVGDITQPSYSKGSFGFDGSYTDIPNVNSKLLGIAQMLLTPGPATVSGGISNLGGLSSYIGSNYAGTNYFATYYAAYFQDNWRPTSSLTLNLGLRWDYSSPYSESDGGQANFQQTGGDGPGGTYYIPKKGCAVPRSSAFNTLLASYNIAVQCVSGLEVNKAQHTNFAPRLGIAYRITPKLVIRAGYGVSYGAFDSVGYGQTLGTNYPFQFQINSPSLTSQTPDILPNGQVASIENTFNAINLQDPAQVSGVGLSLSGKQYDYRTPYVQSANLTIQDQFTNRDSIQVGYVGSLGRNQDVFGFQNSPTQILPRTVVQTNYRPFPLFNVNMQNVITTGVSNYHSLQTVYQHQFKDNFVLLANYTYGKCMSNGGSGFGYFGFRAQWLQGFGIGRDYALCTNDATHVVHVSGEYALPFGRGRQLLSSINRVTDAFIGGWQLNYIYTFQTGQPFTVGCPVSTTSDFGCDANLVPGQNPYAGPHNVTQWLNPSAFAQPPAATAIGQTDFSPLGGAPEQVRGPGFYNVDASLFKNFKLEGPTSFQFRLETFNTLNHPQFSNPGQLNWTTSGFSKITGDRNGYRIVQLAVKMFF